MKKTVSIIAGILVAIIGGIMLYSFFQPWTPPFYSGIAFIVIGLQLIASQFVE